jgi:hypothetical protein
MATACKEFEQELVLYHYSELDEHTRDRIVSHTSVCKDCAGYLDELATLLPLTVKLDEPPQEFWHSYSREMRHKLAEARDSESWWQRISSYFHPWALSALATTAVVAVALTLTLGRQSPAPDEPTEDEAFMEILPMADNLDLLNHMEVLDNLDLLEIMSVQSNTPA